MKKRIFSVFLSVFLIIASIPLGFLAASLGDIDNDNNISAGDARLALRAAVGLETLTPDQISVADADKDGAISAADARLILRAAVGLEELEIVCEPSTDVHKHEHKYTIVETIAEPDCENAGQRKLSCSCGKFIMEEIPALGHKFSDKWEKDKDSHWHICSVCGAKKDKASHKWDGGKVTKVPSCTKKGEKTFTCTVCGYNFSEEIPMNVHSWGDWENVVSPTCTEKGREKHVCSVCGKEEYRDVDAKGHVWGEWENDDEYHWHVCAVCGERPDKVKHNMEIYIEPPTCIIDGYEMLKCTECGYCDESSFKINKKAEGHDWGEWETIEPTCTEKGYTRRKCNKCEVFEDKDIAPPKGHDYEWTVIKEASCIETGVREGKCKVCGEIIQEVIPLTECAPELITIKGDCNTSGTKQWVCSVCGKELSPKVETGKVHKWKVVETIEPTCTTPGKKILKCELCDKEETIEYAPALGHDAHIKEYKQANCEEDGYIEFSSECNRCGAKLKGEKFILKATGHEPVGEVTCTTGITCKKCGKDLEPALGHDVLLENSAFGRNIDGFFCRRCGKVIENKENKLSVFNNVVNSIKGSDFTTMRQVITFGKTSINTEYTRFDFGIYTPAIKNIYNDEMTNQPNEFSPVRKGNIYYFLQLPNSSKVSLLESSDIDSIEIQKLNGIDMGKILSDYPAKYSVGSNAFDISGYKKVSVNKNVIKAKVNVKNEKYFDDIRKLPGDKLPSLAKIYNIDIRNDANEYKNVNGELIMEESQSESGFSVNMRMKLNQICSDGTVDYYFDAETYEPIAAIYKADIKFEQSIKMEFKIGLLSLTGVIDPNVETHYSTVCLFSGYFS